MTEVLHGNLWTARLGAILLAVFGLLAITLTTIGVYGVMAYSVTQRTHEIGIRMALGAAHADVLRMVLRHGVTLTFLGVSVGLAAAFGATRLIANLLYVSPTDGPTFAAVSTLAGHGGHCRQPPAGPPSHPRGSAGGAAPGVLRGWRGRSCRGDSHRDPADAATTEPQNPIII